MGKRKQIIESHDREERKRRRQELGTLQDLTIKPSTVTRYERAFKHFLTFLAHQKLDLSPTKEGVDSQVQDFLEHLWQEGEGVSLAADVLSALQHFQSSLKRHLSGGWRLLRTWQRHEVPARAPPLTWPLMEIIMGFFHYKSPQVALGLGLAFFTLLRTGELLALQSQDIVTPPNSFTAILYLGQTKTAPRNPHAGTAKMVQLLRIWKATVPGDAYLIPWSQTRFRTVWNEAMTKLKLSAFNFKPYSLRRGGATALWLSTHSYSQVCQTGRWSSERTAKIYIQDSIALITDLNFSISPQHRLYQQRWQEAIRCVEPRLAASNRGRGRVR